MAEKINHGSALGSHISLYRWSIAARMELAQSGAIGIACGHSEKG
jgi:hypothetical protein